MNIDQFANSLAKYIQVLYCESSHRKQHSSSATHSIHLKLLLPCPPFLQSDAELLESQARALSGPDGLSPDSSGNELQKSLAAVAAATESGKFAYNRFFAVGLFRCGVEFAGGGSWS